MERSSAVSSSAPAPEAARTVRRFIRKEAAGAGLSRGAGQALTLAVSEASANALGDTETSPLRPCPHYAQARALWPGQPLPLGAHFDGAGTNLGKFVKLRWRCGRHNREFSPMPQGIGGRLSARRHSLS